MFAETASLSNKYLKAVYGSTTREEWLSLRKEAAHVIEQIKTAKQEVYATGPRVHGRREASRLDLLDVWEQKACAVFDNCQANAMKVLK